MNGQKLILICKCQQKYRNKKTYIVVLKIILTFQKVGWYYGSFGIW